MNWDAIGRFFTETARDLIIEGFEKLQQFVNTLIQLLNAMKG